ncbi:MAG: permease for cytosine/purines uracil thiamine allantoin [Firmicutes bacterium]|nr:permease for cytosine/purines uracil thiamine allantoin [Bacillota bacterium]
MNNEAKLQIVKKEEQTMSGIDIALLWIGAGISMAAVFAGEALAGLGMKWGLLVIILGNLIGGIPMYFLSVIGTKEGIPGMVSTRPSFGIRGSFFASLVNVFQLIGWIAVMLLLAAEACVSAAESLHIGDNIYFWVIMLGVIITIFAVIGHKHWKWFQWIIIGTTVLLSIVMTYAVLTQYSFAELWVKEPSGGISFGLGLDSVIAMCLSWVPLVPDYTRYARSVKGAANGTYWGNFVASVWMFFVGLLCAIATGLLNESPVPILSSLGLGLGGLLIILFSTIATTFLAVFSSGVSANNILPKAGEKPLIVIAGILGTLLALIFPMTEYQSFLIIIGAVFIPLEGVVMTDYFLVRKKFIPTELFKKGGSYWYSKGFNIKGFVAFGIGFAVYLTAYFQEWMIGSSCISFVATMIAYYSIAKIFVPQKRS